MEHTRGEKRKRDARESSPSRSRSERPQHDASHRGGRPNGTKSWAHSDQARINQIQEAERHREFLAQEGQFVLRQKRKAAGIRVKEGRARPIDLLTVNLRLIDPIEDLINDDGQEEELEYIDPGNVIEGLLPSQLTELRKGIDDFLDLERKAATRDYWATMCIICKDRQKGVHDRAVRSVSADIDNLLRPKSYEELEKLEKQVNRKIDSDEPIDTDYWQQLLASLLVYKAKAKLKKLYAGVLDSKLAKLRKDNAEAADQAQRDLSKEPAPSTGYSKTIDPDALLNLDAKDKSLVITDEHKFLQDIAHERRKVVKPGYIHTFTKTSTAQAGVALSLGRSADGDKTASSMFDREAAKGVEEDEEVFAGEEHVETKSADLWKGKYRPRKPRYFNRVQMGYEWNKYNQTHYDHDNPPPKVVQGYKFHIFYPDLIDPTRAPTYKITREGGRKKGETVAPAGEEDTCIIRFISGPPYEDIAFRIVDRDWDYSAKHDRGFKSTFEKGILTLHFSFKKVYYRK
ncbi:hypothetical protein PMZ80_002855 [Knufia obscura]|uniref:Splicing factor Cactin n=2 Tax=Knufia TaxID=430999 RepID=A0AAN8EEX9_9EURO|nr:hypothetical protein PMZ80_002855 [Knufia obscura]KAK5952555.1 hypothetical protein OHC33_006601 [Knufia fluminis]